MESSTSSWTVPSLHQLLSFDYPKLSLVKCDDDDETSSSSSSPRRRRSNVNNKRHQVPSSPSPCRICDHPSHGNQVLDEGTHLLASLLLEGTGDWTLCPLCLSVVRRFLRLTEEVEDIKVRIKTVIKLVEKSQSLPPLDDGCPSPSPTHLKASFATLQPSSLHADDDEEDQEMIVLKEEPQGPPPPLHVVVEEEEDDAVSTPSSDPSEEEENDGVTMSIEGPFTIPAAPIQTSQGGAEEEEMEMANQSKNENYHASVRSQGDDTSPIQSESFPSRNRVYRMRASTRQKKGKVDPDVPPPPPPRRTRGRPRHLPRQFHSHSHPLPCYFCGKTFSSDRSIEYHIRIHTLESPFLCAKCGAEFRFNESLRKHVTSNCGSSKVQTVQTQRPTKPHQSPKQGKQQCHLCGTLVASSRELGIHMKVRHQALKVSLSLEGTSGYQCPKCVKTYVIRSSLVHHMRIHHLLDPSERQFCPICHEYFRSKDGLVAHTHVDQNNDPSKVLYICQISICGKTFPTREKYARHRNEIHRKRGSQCPTCGKVFRQSKSLVRHNRTCSVTLEVQGTCSVQDCGKTFGSLEERMDHERVVHRGLSSTRCHFCSKVFSSTERLSGHMRLHTLEAPLRCEECGKNFRWCERFRVHRALVCGGDEDKKEKVRRRKREETRAFRAKLAYACDLCHKRFGQKPQLVSHKRREHFI